MKSKALTLDDIDSLVRYSISNVFFCLKLLPVLMVVIFSIIIFQSNDWQAVQTTITDFLWIKSSMITIFWGGAIYCLTMTIANLVSLLEKHSN
ncbi:hypothetical protein [Vibrio cyclitrophicus]|uniref:hypothetical protein n=1 Tax=Vibrio cyclitrophicus TaxID=47951 RepID=UPI0013014D15|nr:hypothetical protein [Vibrio cyclitrophicus]